VKTLQLTTSNDARLLETHGVASASDILEVLHPDGLSLLDSITSQHAYVVVKGSMKIVDVATNNWPINLAQAKDIRSNLKQPVQLGNEIGTVAGCFGDLILFKGSSESLVPIHDLMPVMVKAGVEAWEDTHPKKCEVEGCTLPYGHPGDHTTTV